jgi:iron(III) transport system permease protein
VYVLTNQIYSSLQLVLPADYAKAFSMAFLLLVSALLLVALYSKSVGQRSYTTVSGRSFSTRLTRLGRWRWPAFALIAVYLLLSLVLPAIVLVYASYARTAGVDMLSAEGYTLNNWIAMVELSLPRQSIGNTIILSLGAATIGGVVGTIIAYVSVRTTFRGKSLLDLAAWIPWAVPTLVLGIGLLRAFAAVDPSARDAIEHRLGPA